MCHAADVLGVRCMPEFWMMLADIQLPTSPAHVWMILTVRMSKMLDLSFLMGPQGFIMEEVNNRRLVANKTHMQEISGLFQGRLILEYPCMFLVLVFFAFYKKKQLKQAHIWDKSPPPRFGLPLQIMSHFYIVRFKCVSTQLASTEKWFEQFLVLFKKSVWESFGASSQSNRWGGLNSGQNRSFCSWIHTMAVEHGLLQSAMTWIIYWNQHLPLGSLIIPHSQAHQEGR